MITMEFTNLSAVILITVASISTHPWHTKLYEFLTITVLSWGNSPINNTEQIPQSFDYIKIAEVYHI